MYDHRIMWSTFVKSSHASACENSQLRMPRPTHAEQIQMWLDQPLLTKTTFVYNHIQVHMHSVQHSIN